MDGRGEQTMQQTCSWGMNSKISMKVNIAEGLTEKVKNGTARRIRIITHSTSRSSVESWILEA